MRGPLLAHFRGIWVAAFGLALLVSVPLIAAEATGHPKLYFSSSDLPLLRERLNTPFGKRVKTRLDSCLLLDRFKEATAGMGAAHAMGYWMAGHAFRYLLERNPHDLERVNWYIDTLVKGGTEGRGTAKQALRTGFAIGYDLIANEVDAARKQKMIDLMKGWISGSSYPTAYDKILENSAFATATSSMLCLLALKGDIDDTYFAQQHDRTVAHIDTFFATTGGCMWENEWSNYERGVSEIAIPMFEPYVRVMGKRLTYHDRVDKGIEYYMMSDGVANLATDAGLVMSWPPAALGIVRPELKPAVKFYIDEYFARDHIDVLDVRSRGTSTVLSTFIPLLMHYPFDRPAQNPGAVLPKYLYGQHGGIIFRQGFDLQKDAAVIVDFRTRNNIPRSAGGVAILGFGTGLVTKYNGTGKFTMWSGGHGFPIGWSATTVYDDAWKGSAPKVPRVAGMIPASGAVPIYASVDKSTGSGVVSMRIDKWVKAEPSGSWCCQMFKVTDPTDQGVRVLRAVGVDFSKISGCDAVVVVVDRITGAGNSPTGVQFSSNSGNAFVEGYGPTPSKNWPWPSGDAEQKWSQIQFSSNASTCLALPGRSIVTWNSGTLTKDNYVASTVPTAKYTFIGDDVKLSMFTTKKSDLKALASSGEYFMIMTLQNGKGPDPQVISGSGLNSRVKIGNQEISFDGTKVVFKTLSSLTPVPLDYSSGVRDRPTRTTRLSWGPSAKRAAFYDLRGRIVVKGSQENYHRAPALRSRGVFIVKSGDPHDRQVLHMTIK